MNENFILQNITDIFIFKFYLILHIFFYKCIHIIVFILYIKKKTQKKNSKVNYEKLIIMYFIIMYFLFLIYVALSIDWIKIFILFFYIIYTHAYAHARAHNIHTYLGRRFLKSAKVKFLRNFLLYRTYATSLFIHRLFLNPNNLVRLRYKNHGFHSHEKSMLIIDEATRKKLKCIWHI